MAAASPVYLHIQTDHDDNEAPTRVLEMGSGPIRVGRGIQCEVRLNQVGLGDVQAILRYRNNEWQVQPVGPPGRIWVDGRPADQQRSLAVGVPLRVGRSTLTIHQASASEGGRGSFDAPISVDAEPVLATPPPQPRPFAAIPITATPDFQITDLGPEPTPTVGDDRVERWQSRLDQRDQWLKDRQSEKRWEARWKAAGETIRDRSGRPETTPPKPPPAPLAPPGLAQRPESPLARSPLVGLSAPVRSFEPRPVFSPPRRMPPPESTSPPESPRTEVEPAPVVIPQKFQATPIEALPIVDWTLSPIEPAPAESKADADDFADLTDAIQADTPPPEVNHPVSLVEDERVESPVPPDDRVADVVEVESISVAFRERGEPAACPDFVEPEARGLIPPARLESPHSRVAPVDSAPISALAPMARRPSVNEEARPPRPEPHERVTPRQPTASPPTTPGQDWPSARTIFDAQGTRANGPLPGPIRTNRAIEPTEALPPPSWTIPFALGWLPAMAVVLLVGTGTLGLAVVWALESQSANLGIRLATRVNGRSLTIDPEILPKAAWWRTSASSLAAWGIALERSGKSAEARELEADARTVSPLGARARFLQEPVVGAEADEMASIRLGPTRDIVTLTAMGHRLRRDGKKADAIRAYRAALLIAASTARSTLGKPVFRADSTSNRYHLPHSTLLDAIARDMDDAGDWTADEWTEATPEFGPSLLAVADALRAKHPDEADRRLEAICQTADRVLAPQFDAAEDHAATAEAMAERGRWTDAVALYHQAIDDETRDLDRRVWWFNLAELAGKTGDLDARNQAIENAKGTDLSDEVTQRAANAHRLNPESTKLSVQNR